MISPPLTSILVCFMSLVCFMRGGLPACWGLHITYIFIIASNLYKSLGLGLECKHQPSGVLLGERH